MYTIREIRITSLLGDNRYLREQNKQLWRERDELADELMALRVSVLSGLTEEQLKAVVSNVQVCSLWNEIQRLKTLLQAASQEAV